MRANGPLPLKKANGINRSLGYCLSVGQRRRLKRPKPPGPPPSAPVLCIRPKFGFEPLLEMTWWRGLRNPHQDKRVYLDSALLVPMRIPTKDPVERQS